ncbi:MAG: hypothetical protein Q9168_004033 [Polycauliona sp. 1 TL-2023]
MCTLPGNSILLLRLPEVGLELPQSIVPPFFYVIRALVRPDNGEFSEAMGWGNVIEAEAEEHKEMFETEMGGDEAKFYEYWPAAFRWTCCGVQGDSRFGCDHHGQGSTPCTCDFCKMGKPIPDGVQDERMKSAGGKGLELSRGPDPRSFNRASAGVTAGARGILGLTDGT